MTGDSSTSAPSESAYPIVYFDGVCGLCNAFVDFLLRIDTYNRMKFAPLQGETARLHLPEEDRQQLGSVVFQRGPQTWRHSAAVVRILLTAGGLWALAGALIWLIPAPLRNLGYRFIAVRRYRMFGKKETCRLPTPAERAKFLP